MADPTSRSGTRYVDPAILAYVERVHVPHDPALARAFDAPAAHGMPEIQVSPSEGKLLGLLVRALGARKVVEVGTLAGYSAIHLARGLAGGGKLWTIEYEPSHAEIARRNLAVAGVADRVEVLVGAGLDVLPTLEAEAPLDVVFIDADKINYPAYGAWAARHLRPGGLLIGDNAYLFGNLLDDSERGRAMRQFHEEAAAAFDSVCVPTPDGMVVGIRRG